MSGKEQVMEAMSKMRECSTCDEVVEGLQLLGAIREGRQVIDQGDVVPHEEVVMMGP